MQMPGLTNTWCTFESMERLSSDIHRLIYLGLNEKEQKAIVHARVHKEFAKLSQVIQPARAVLRKITDNMYQRVENDIFRLCQRTITVNSPSAMYDVWIDLKMVHNTSKHNKFIMFITYFNIDTHETRELHAIITAHLHVNNVSFKPYKGTTQTDVNTHLQPVFKLIMAYEPKPYYLGKGTIHIYRNLHASTKRSKRQNTALFGEFRLLNTSEHV